MHHGAVRGAEGIDRLVHITQKPIGRTPRSCLATYTGFFDRVRRLFADTPEARRRGWGVGRFSYNVAEGRCPECHGTGQIEVELLFLPGSYATCPRCHGTRYGPETLEVRWEGLTIADVLELSVARAREVFTGDPRISRALDALAAMLDQERAEAAMQVSAISRSGSRRPSSPAARRSGSSWPPSCSARCAATACTCWTSRPPASTPPTWTCW